MIEIQDKTKCSGCHSCQSICPKQCIKMIEDEEGFLYPSVVEENCIRCGLCENICSILYPLGNDKEESDICAYAAYTKDDEIRKNSSSGGMFTEIARWVIGRQGVVFGAAFDGAFQVRHMYAETEEALAKFRGSKYVQSIIGDSYMQAKRFLDEGRWVLFTGTPCQIGGLLKYLPKSYEKLLTQDIICHGVPSPLVWRKYREYREEQSGGGIEHINFRNKAKGWNPYYVEMNFSDGKEYLQISGKDLYMRTFLSDLCLRPSCYDCRFKQKVRSSDFTLADFWGIDNVQPEMNDNKGTSLFFVNSDKGQKVFANISERLVFKQVDTDSAIQYNPSMLTSVKKPAKRDAFMAKMRTQPIDKAMKQTLPKSFPPYRFSMRIVRKAGRMLKGNQVKK